MEAYEVLSNPDQRRIYDASRSQGLPAFMRAAAAGSMHGPGEPAGDPSTWRYGWGTWASEGPFATAATTYRGGGARAPWEGYAALLKNRDALESELYEALMVAFLGPRYGSCADDAWMLPPRTRQHAWRG